MHIGYLVLAVRDVLRERLSRDGLPFKPFDREEIEVSPDGRPPAYMGSRFIGVYGSQWSPAVEDSNVGLDALMGVSCTYTVRSPVFPQKKTGPVMYAEVLSGMCSVCWEVAKAVSMTGDSLTEIPLYEALAKYPDYVPYSIFEYLRWEGCDPSPSPVTDEWFTARNEHLMDENGLSIVGYTMTVRFGGARGGYAYR
jgi:hypothetical protein